MISERTGDPAATARLLVDTPVDLTSRAFAYRPKPMSRMTAVPSQGEPRYTGQTFAVDKGGDVFSGAINLRAWLGIERIEADTTNLISTKDDTAWQYECSDVTKISLPR